MKESKEKESYQRRIKEKTKEIMKEEEMSGERGEKMEMTVAIMAATQEQAGASPAALWHWKLHLLGGARVCQQTDPSSVVPSTVRVGVRLPLCSFISHQMHLAAGFVVVFFFCAAPKKKF